MLLVGSLLLDADEMVAKKVRSIVHGVPYEGPGECHRALGVVRGERLIGGVVFFNYRGHDIEIAIGFDRQAWATPDVLRGLFAYPFGQLGCERVTAQTGASNVRAQRLLERTNWKLEGVKRRGQDGTEDALVYGLLRNDCKWWKQ
jgi:RimJ/RimL family protein N-acetyltransferase